jgi:hypothetical protein
MLTEPVRWLFPSREQHICQLLTFEEVDDHKLSQFLRHIRSLAPHVPDDFLRNIWSSQLPPYIQAIVASLPKGNLDTVSHCADRIIEAAPQLVLASVAPLPERNALLHRIEELSVQVARREGPPSLQL